MRTLGSGIAVGLWAVLWGAAAHASCPNCNVTLTYPGAAPCDTTLQACIDSASAGDTVQIATNGPIAESPHFQKSLTLIAAPSFAPLFSGAQAITVATPSTGGSAIHVEGLTFEQGQITVTQQSTGALDVQVIGNTFQQSLPGLTGAIELDSGAGALGNVTFDVSGNAITVPSGAYGVAIAIALGAGTSSLGTIAQNSITLQGSSLNGSGILIGDTGQCVTTSVDVIANRIAASALSDSSGTAAISTFQHTGCAGPIALRILDNLVTGTSSGSKPFAGLTSAIVGGTFSATVVNNTVTGFQQCVDFFPDASAAASGVVANNIVSTCDLGIALSAAIPNRNNLLFDNAAEQFSPDPSTLAADPLFASAGSDYHLRHGSPAIDAGDDGSVPGDLTTDLDGSARIQGAHVDLGVYEAPEPSGSLDAVVGLSALAALASRRRPLASARRWADDL
jgi:hypothetical protein